MNVSKELQVSEEAVVRALYATQANDAAGPPRHSAQTDQCPNIARFAVVLRFGGKWTPEEDAHIAGGCPFCQKVFAMFADATREETEHDADTGEETTVDQVKGSEDTVQ
jgi:hypothetical protein